MNTKIFFTLSLVLSTCTMSHAKLFINEVNSVGKWIEIYNDGDAGVNVGGYTVTRFNNDNTYNMATIPNGTTIASKGHIVLYQGSAGSPIKGAIDCLPFGISTDKFWYVELYDSEDKMIDNTFNIGVFGQISITGDKSWARETDGGTKIVALEPTPGRPNTAGALEPSDLKIFINEVNSNGKWIEIYNDEAVDVDISGFTLARFNNDNATAQIGLPAGAVIKAKGFLVLFQGEAALSPVAGALDCMNFGISSDKFWYIVLKDTDSRLVDNTLNIGNPQKVFVANGRSWARQTDGNATIVVLEPTPGNPNKNANESTQLKLYINEVNSTRKWIEIYNDENNTVDVGGYTVTRYNNDGGIGIALIPIGKTIAAKGFLVIYQGEAASSPFIDAIDCMPFGISSNRFMRAILRDNHARLVDNTFNISNPQTVSVNGGQSWARLPDGGATINAMDPTPGKSNASQPTLSGLKVFINEVNAYGKWIELYNDEDKVVDISGFSIIRYNNDNAIAITIIPAGITIPAKGLLVLYQEGVSSPSVGAKECLTFGISSDKFWYLLLRDDQDILVDNTFDVGNPQRVTVNGNQSWARKPDGGASIVAVTPTPGVTPNLKIYQADIRAFVYAGTMYLPESVSHFQLYTTSGILVLNRNNNATSIDLTTLTKGVYIVRLSVSGQIFTQKIIL